MRLERSTTGTRRLLSDALNCLAVGAGIVIVGLVDYITGADIQIVSLYFVPLAFAGWRLGKVGATIASLTAGSVWLAAIYLAGTRYRDDYVWAVNFVTQTVAFLTVSLLVATLTDKLRQEEILRRTDALTGLHNRQAFLDQAGTALTLCKRHGRPSALAYLDLDNFKSANDRFGHACGDRLLRQCGAILRASLRESDVAARMGGDEFVIFLPEARRDAAMKVVERIVEVLEMAADFRAAAVTASVGLVAEEGSTLGLEELLVLADAQMYEAKQAGKNGVARKR